MGIDRFSNFILKSVNNDSIEEVNVNNNIRIVAANCIIFDANFLIYQEILEIENEVNDIIKIILCLPFINDNYSLLEDYLKKILLQTHWKVYNFQNLFDGFNEDEIITKFITSITNKIPISNNTNELLSIIELIIYEKILNKIVYLINKMHHTNFIQSIAIFFDGIPSFSKVIEQRHRRIKTYLESQERKKLYKIYFDKLEINNKKLIENLSKNYDIDNNNIDLYFNYIKWIKNRFTTNKSISPSSVFINKLEEFLELKLNKIFPKCKIIINSSKENGESDLKIFKFIALNENNYDYSIHTLDSDLIHQILVQQTYYKIINKNINLCLIKYIKKNNIDDFAQIIDAPNIIKHLLESYNNINNIKTNNYKIIWDLCLLFYFFGNDHLPSSIEIGPELGLDYFYSSHYKALNNNNIINLKKSYISFDLNNFKLLLQKINESKDMNITKIILYRYFKISCQLINLLVDKFKLNFEGIKDFLRKFIINRGLNFSSNDIDDSDMRKLFCNNIENHESYKDFSIFGFNEINTKLLIDSINLIEENIDYYDCTYNGLILYNKNINITNDVYQDLYNFINEKTIINLTKQYPSFYEFNDINQQLYGIKLNSTNDYLKKMYNLILSQFGNMKDFYSNNLTYYKYYCSPSLSSIIDFINQIDPDINQTKIWLTEIKNENVNIYLDSTSHYLLISPFLLQPYNLSNENYKKLGNIDNLWINENIDTFDYKNIDIKEFLKIWSNISTNKTSNELIII